MSWSAIIMYYKGFELKYNDSENTIHFSIFMMQIFPPSQYITIKILPKSLLKKIIKISSSLT